MALSDKAQQKDPLLRSTSAPADFDTYQQVQMLWNLLDRSYVGVFWKDLEGRFMGGNDWFVELFGVDSVDDLIGKTDYDFFDKETAEAYRSDDFAVLKSGIPRYDIDETLERREGSVEVLKTSKMPVWNADGEIVALMGCFQIVTTMVETEQALESLQSRFALALETSRDGMWEYDIAANVFEVTPRFLELLDLDPQASALLTLDEISDVFGSAPKDFVGAADRLVTGEIDKFATRRSFQTKDGSTRWLSVKGFPFRETGETVTHIVGSLADVTAKVEQENQLLYRASHDSLTGLANRSNLLDYLNNALEDGTPVGVLFLDLDEFKVINDSLGHQVGDQLLQATASRLGSLIREGQVLARLGGDEFALVIPNCSAEAAVETGERILTALAEPLVLNLNEIYLTCSIGAVHSDGQYRSATDILRDGDIALYSAKRDGRACVKQFEPWMGKEADALLQLQTRVRRAVSQDEFLLHYQPIVSTADGSVCGVEALMRWLPDHGQLLEPDSFLAYLEHTGLIKAVGDWVIGEAIGQLARWQKDYPQTKDLAVSLNTSRIQFRSPELFETIAGALRSYGVAPECLIIEVTETAITEDFETLSRTLDQLRDLGVKIAIDDFGVGQSSLSALYDIPADIVKMDRAFVHRIEDGTPEPMIDAMVAIAQSAGLKITAEGVETQGQHDYLKQAGCEFSQGFLFGAPMPPEDIADQLF